MMYATVLNRAQQPAQPCATLFEATERDLLSALHALDLQAHE